MSPAEVTAGRAAIEHLKAAGGEFMDEPVLAAMTTHPRLLPVLLELMEGEPHLVSAGAPVKQPDSEGHGAAGRRNLLGRDGGPLTLASDIPGRDG